MGVSTGSVWHRLRYGCAVSSEVGSSQRRSAYLLLAVNIAIGSVSFTLVQLSLKQLTPLALAAGRVVVSALMFMAVVMRWPTMRTPILRADRWRVFVIGFVGSAVFHLLFNWGQHHVSVAIAAVIMATYPVMTTVGEVIFLGYRLRRLQVIGVMLSTLGCIVIGLANGIDGGGGSVWGAVVVALAALSWAAVTIITRDIGERYNSWWLNTPGTVAGAVFMLIVAAPDLHQYAHLSWRVWLAVIWLGSASSAFIYYSLAKVMTVLSATTTSAITTVVTPTSVLVAWLVLGDAPTLVDALGGLVVIGGVILVVLRRGD
jgi:drug/metabolite transporter (DMT)-like permease